METRHEGSSTVGISTRSTKWTYHLHFTLRRLRQAERAMVGMAMMTVKIPLAER